MADFEEAIKPVVEKIITEFQQEYPELGKSRERLQAKLEKAVVVLSEKVRGGRWAVQHDSYPNVSKPSEKLERLLTESESSGELKKELKNWLIPALHSMGEIVFYNKNEQALRPSSVRFRLSKAVDLKHLNTLRDWDKVFKLLFDKYPSLAEDRHRLQEKAEYLVERDYRKGNADPYLFVSDEDMAENIISGLLKIGEIQGQDPSDPELYFVDTALDKKNAAKEEELIQKFATEHSVDPEAVKQAFEENKQNFLRPTNVISGPKRLSEFTEFLKYLKDRAVAIESAKKIESEESKGLVAHPKEVNRERSQSETESVEEVEPAVAVAMEKQSHPEDKEKEALGSPHEIVTSSTSAQKKKGTLRMDTLRSFRDKAVSMGGKAMSVLFRSKTKSKAKEQEANTGNVKANTATGCGHVVDSKFTKRLATSPGQLTGSGGAGNNRDSHSKPPLKPTKLHF